MEQRCGSGPLARLRERARVRDPRAVGFAASSDENQAARNTLTPTLSRKRERETSCFLALGQDFLRSYAITVLLRRSAWA